MTNKEAIKRLKEVQAEFNENWVDYGGINEAFKKAYRALEERPQEEKPFEINVFLENADESTLFDIKKQLAQILTDRAEREAYEEARREAMRLDDNEDTYKWRGHA